MNILFAISLLVLLIFVFISNWKKFKKLVLFIILFTILFGFYQISKDILSFYRTYEKNPLLKEIKENAEGKGFAFSFKLNRYDKEINVLPLLRKIKFKSNLGRIVYLPGGNGYIVELKNSLKLAHLNSNFETEGEYNHLKVLSKGMILGRPSQDGRKLLFYGMDLKSREKGLCVLDILSGKHFFILKNFKFQSEELNGLYFSWYKNDGIVFIKPDSENQFKLLKKLNLFLLDLKTLKIKKIFTIEDDGILKYPFAEISPDGRLVAYFSQNALFIRDLKNSKRFTFTLTSPSLLMNESQFLVWSPDSKYLFYLDIPRFERVFYCEGSKEQSFSKWGIKIIRIFDSKNFKFLNSGFGVKRGYPFFIKSKDLILKGKKREKYSLFYFFLILFLSTLNLFLIAFYGERFLKKFSSIINVKNFGFLLILLLFSIFLLINSIIIFFKTQCVNSFFLNFDTLWFTRFLISSLITLPIIFFNFRKAKAIDISNLKNIFLFIFFTGCVVLTFLSKFGIFWSLIFSLIYFEVVIYFLKSKGKILT